MTNAEQLIEQACKKDEARYGEESYDLLASRVQSFLDAAKDAIQTLEFKLEREQSSSHPAMKYIRPIPRQLDELWRTINKAMGMVP